MHGVDGPRCSMRRRRIMEDRRFEQILTGIVVVVAMIFIVTMLALGIAVMP